jgi:hypothetical protein
MFAVEKNTVELQVTFSDRVSDDTVAAMLNAFQAEHLTGVQASKGRVLAGDGSTGPWISDPL